MSRERTIQPDISSVSQLMKRDWDERARRDAKWFINSNKFQQTDEEFDESGRVEVERLVLADLGLLAQNRDPRSLQILEIGCGVGRMTRHLAGVFGQIVGADVSGEMIKRARERLAGVPNVALYETSGADLAPLPDESFDLVLAAYVFQHVPTSEVIASNLREAWRVLKPGGVFKFQAIGITTLDFEETEKDTWVGASYPEAEIRRFASDCEAQLIAITGGGTRYCWTTLRKRVAPDLDSRRYWAGAPPAIACYGRADALEIKHVPTSGCQAAVGLIISNLGYKQADCNSVAIEVGDQISLPCYVGPIKCQFEAALKAEFGDRLDQLTQVEAYLPINTPTGASHLCVIVEGRGRSDQVEIEFEREQPVIPRICGVFNAYDDGPDLYATGRKSGLKLVVEGLDEAADGGNVRIRIGLRIIRPQRIIALGDDHLYQVEAQIPEGIKPGRTELCLYFGDLQSPSVVLEIN